MNDDVGFSPVDDRHGDQEEHQQHHNYDDTTIEGGGVWSSSSLVVVGNQPEDQIYAYETIDPTLLRGGKAPLGVVESELNSDLMDVLGLESDRGASIKWEVDVGLSNNDDESSSAGSLHSFAYPPPPKKTYQKKKEEEKTVASSSYERKLPPRNRIKQI